MLSQKLGIIADLIVNSFISLASSSVSYFTWNVNSFAQFDGSITQMTTKLTLFSFWQDKQKEWGRRITVVEVSKATGINRATLAAYLDDKVKRPDLEVISKLCTFFGAAPGPVEFIRYEPD